jgi:voltage-gated potassium channel Kch
VSGVAAVSERRAPTLLVTGLVIVTLVLRWLTHAIPGVVVESASALSAFACLGLLAGVVMLQVFRKGPISWHRIQGAVAVYLLLGMMWAFAYLLLLLQFPGAFQPADLGADHAARFSNLVYFSFVTLTTVGYGDITPAHPIVRALATLEALVGQLYPAILIGRLVAMELSARQSRSREP